MSRSVEITNNLNNKNGDTEERLDFNDMYNSFKINLQLNSAYEISFTATYTQQYKDAYNMLKMGRGIWYDGREYYINQLENGFDENGLATKQITAHAILIDLMKNVRLDPKQPTEDSPEVSGDSSSDSSDSDDSQQTGTVVKKTDEQETHSLQELLDKFFKDNDQGISYELHGNFPKQAIDCSGSLYEWLGNNLTSFGAYYVPHNYVLKIYDLESLKLPTDVQLRYLHNVTSVDIQSDGNDFYNDFDVYGGKMEKDITTAGSGNGVNEPVNGDWTPVIQNAASLVGEHLSQSDISLVLAQINLESSGRENAKGGDDGLSDGIAMGLLQFKQGTFNYYCRPPYTNIWHGLDQIIALFNVPNWRSQITGRHGWSPHGAPVSKSPIQAQQASSTAGVNNIVSFCRSFVGKVPYVWGGSTTSGWDCSGFVCYVLNHFGINTPRTNTVGLESKGTIVGPPLIKRVTCYSGVLVVLVVMFQLRWIRPTGLGLITNEMVRFAERLLVGHQVLPFVFLGLAVVMQLMVVTEIVQQRLLKLTMHCIITFTMKRALRCLVFTEGHKYLLIRSMTWIHSSNM